MLCNGGAHNILGGGGGEHKRKRSKKDPKKIFKTKIVAQIGIWKIAKLVMQKRYIECETGKQIVNKERV